LTNEPPRIVFFGPEIKTECSSIDFGNKASVLTRMSADGIPVPPGFALSVDICREYFQNDQELPDDVPELLRQGISFIERSTDQGFGASRHPLLVSARSGAPVSMPGAMETILNLGLNRDTLRGLIAKTGNPKFAWDTYRRFLENFGTVVYTHDPLSYRRIIKDIVGKEQIGDEADLDFVGFRTIAEEFEDLYSRTNGRHLPTDVFDQLERATAAIFDSWENPRAITFRKMNPDFAAKGTGVTIQAMVFGNLGSLSGAGVAFSRNPWTGTNELLVDFKFGAQGEDIVSGHMGVVSHDEFSARIPLAARELSYSATRLETIYNDMQDIEFTVQEGKLYILQCRSGKRAPLAALKIAVEMVKENIIEKKEALYRIRSIDINSLAIQTLETSVKPLAKGISASMGVASGKIALSSERAAELSKTSPVILIRETANPDDISGIASALGILTVRGARTSHAAVVARQMGKVCIVSCDDMKIDQEHRKVIFSGHELYEGDLITIDGSSGSIYAGIINTSTKKPIELIKEIKSWGYGK